MRSHPTGRPGGMERRQPEQRLTLRKMRGYTGDLRTFYAL